MRPIYKEVRLLHKFMKNTATCDVYQKGITETKWND